MSKKSFYKLVIRFVDWMANIGEKLIIPLSKKEKSK